MSQLTPFVPADLDCSSWPALEPLYKALLARPISTKADFQAWLRDFSDLDETIDEYSSWKYIDNTCHTDDAEIEKAYMHVVENIDPNIKPIYFELQKKLIAAAKATGADSDPVIAYLVKRWQADVDVYRAENIPLSVQDTKLSTEYGKVCGAMMVEYQGKQQTLQQMSRYLEETDRAVREEAWKLVVDRRMEDREKVDELFDKLVPLRDQMGRNAGHSDYRSFIWLVKKRFDYTPQMCIQFGDSCEKLIVPLIEEIDEQDAADLGVAKLRPWDTAVDPKHRPPLRPFEQDDIAGFVEKTRRMFHRMSPYFGKQFATMKLGETLDLDSRKGKRPGGYQCSLEKSRKPFIFMNAAGLQGDVETLLHEGGHAFHHLEACDNVDLTFVRHAPLEFCEVASMSMELLAADAYDEFYSADDAARAKRKSIERAIRVLPWVATIDGFQHWIYTHPKHTRDERTAYWLTLLGRFGSKAVDWTGLEDARASMWQRQSHLFGVPFYYIEYGIAELGALQLWLQYKKDPETALTNYRKALALGGTRPLPQLFAAAGVSFDFSASTIAPLVEAVREELAAIPA
ncbi:MAG: M3 family oligoendopeptidase [Phycisphaeraceae bacterium]